MQPQAQASYLQLSDIENEKLVQFNSDAIMKEAVKKVLLAEIFDRGVIKAGAKVDPTRNFALALAFDPKVSNEELGADLKASANAVSLLEQGFGRIGTYKDKSTESGSSTGNKAL